MSRWHIRRSNDRQKRWQLMEVTGGHAVLLARKPHLQLNNGERFEPTGSQRRALLRRGKEEVVSVTFQNAEKTGDCMGDALRGQKKDPSNLKACDCVGEDFLRQAVADHKLFERQGRFPAAALMHCSLLQLPLMGSGQ